MLIEAGIKYYNANSRGASAEDCVKRSLSLALGIDYDKVSAELNRIKRNYGYGAYNETRVFNKFLASKGLSFHNIDRSQGLTTVDQFCESHPTGTYLLLTGRGRAVAKGKGDSSHMCCVINGDVYDSWDSTEDIIFDVCKVSDSSDEIFNLNVTSINPAMHDFVEDYFKNADKKYPQFTFEVGKSYTVDQYTGWVRVFIKIVDNPGKYSDYYKNFTKSHKFVWVMNPKLTEDENINILQKKLKTKMYDFIYPFAKDWKDSQKIQSEEGKYTNITKQSDMKLLYRLPEYLRTYVSMINSWWGGSEYEAQTITDRYVSGENWSELLSDLKYYYDCDIEDGRLTENGTLPEE